MGLARGSGVSGGSGGAGRWGSGAAWGCGVASEAAAAKSASPNFSNTWEMGFEKLKLQQFKMKRRLGVVFPSLPSSSAFIPGTRLVLGVGRDVSRKRRQLNLGF